MPSRFVGQNGRLIRTLLAVRVLDRDDILRVTPFADYGVLLEIGRNTGIDHQAGVGRTDAEYVLRNGEPVPCRGTGQPAVLALTGLGGFLTGYHLAIDVGLNAVQLLILDPCGTDLAIQVPRIVAASGFGLGDDDPWVVMTEDAAVLLVSGRLQRERWYLLS